MQRILGFHIKQECESFFVLTLIQFTTIAFFLSLLPVMAKIGQLYKNNINGLIFTLLFHILVFAFLNISQFRVKRIFQEPEIIIDFTEEIVNQPESVPERHDEENTTNPIQNQTNIASNRLALEKNEKVNRELQHEMEQARQLADEVRSQLGKEIPTINDLKMPVETTEGLNPDSLKKKLYTGDSNIEYYLENRYHIRMPKPVYLTHKGGKVEVLITVDKNGMVTEAHPVITPGLSELLLSYAKTAALQTRFNTDLQAPQKQQGKMIYRFITQ
jgi:hypothetical protein